MPHSSDQVANCGASTAGDRQDASLQEALLVLAVALGAVASAVAIVIAPLTLAAPDATQLGCQSSFAQRPADNIGNQSKHR